MTSSSLYHISLIITGTHKTSTITNNLGILEEKTRLVRRNISWVLQCAIHMSSVRSKFWGSGMVLKSMHLKILKVSKKKMCSRSGTRKLIKKCKRVLKSAKKGKNSVSQGLKRNNHLSRTLNINYMYMSLLRFQLNILLMLILRNCAISVLLV